MARHIGNYLGRPVGVLVVEQQCNDDTNQDDEDCNEEKGNSMSYFETEE